jgi:5'-nucleotidase
MSPRPQKPLILLTNDDGFFAPGIEILASKIHDLGDVYIVAPDREKSATSLALTLRQPLRAHRVRDRVFAVDGTPADCIYLALRKILPRKPDLVLSGINPGPNLGQQDVAYSGTVAGALQAAFFHIPSLAVSCMADGGGRLPFDFAAGFAHETARRFLKAGLPLGTVLNINVPPPPIKGIMMTALGEKRYSPEVIEKTDPRNNIYYWIGMGKIKAVGGRGSDVRALERGYISVTPLHKDMTDYVILGLPALKALFTFSPAGSPVGAARLR